VGTVREQRNCIASLHKMNVTLWKAGWQLNSYCTFYMQSTMLPSVVLVLTTFCFRWLEIQTYTKRWLWMCKVAATFLSYIEDF